MSGIALYERTGRILCDTTYPSIGPSIEGDNLLQDILENLGDQVLIEKIENNYPYNAFSGYYINQISNLVFTIGIHIEEGDFQFNEGDQGLSEVTDWILDKMFVGNANIIDILDEYDGRVVTIRVDTGPEYKIGK